MRRKVTLILCLLTTVASLNAQSTLTLEDCRRLAVENNKQLSVAKLNINIASDQRQSARTKYLPRVDALAGYELMSKEISLLNNDQKAALNHLGTNAAAGATGSLSTVLTGMVQQGVISPEMATQLGQQLGSMTSSIAMMGDDLGNTIRQAFRTNNRSMAMGSVMVNQPLYMGGSITALNRIAEINEDMAANTYDLTLQNTLYEIDAAYWLVVSLKQKQRLATSYYDLVKKLDEDVHKMISQGVATHADGLNIDVRVNEAEMSIMKVEDNLTLSKMLLCQLCGIDMHQEITLADEDKDQLTYTITPLQEGDINIARPELRMIENSISLSKQASKIITATYYRPQIALTGGYMISNPNVYNGFQHRFAGVWNLGVLVRMPIWNWNEGRYKLHASQAATNIAEYEQSDLREKISLQVEQHRFKLKEAEKRLSLSKKHVASAEENLRCANLGFKEGVMSLTDVMAAQTAWQSAHTEIIDAEIEVQLSQVGLKKALGQLQ